MREFIIVYESLNPCFPDKLHKSGLTEQQARNYVRNNKCELLDYCYKVRKA